MATQSLSQIPVAFNGMTFLLDVAEGNLMSLNAIYAAAGSPANKDAPAWLRNSDVAAFMLTVVGEKTTDFKHLADVHLKQRPEKKEKSKELTKWCNEAYDLAVKAGFAITKRGRHGGGTWAHWKIATKYAAYLEPALESAILDVFQERVQEEANPELAIKRGRDRAIAAWRRQGKTEDWIEQRCKQIDSWHGFTDTLKEHGVTGDGYGRCADSLNVPILGGTSKQIRKARSIVGKSLRDGLDEVENAAINFAQVLAKKKIKEDNVHGNYRCSIACYKSAEKVAQVL
jgi:hypothetical protein